MRKLILLLGLALLFTHPVSAQDYPKGEFFAGYSYVNIDGKDVLERPQAHGLGVSFSGNVNKYFGFTGDLAGQYGSLGLGDLKLGIFGGVPSGADANADHATYQFLFGPRITGRGEGVTGFVHALVGFNHTRFTNISATIPGVPTVTFPNVTENSFAMSFGGGVDINASKRVAIRVIQVDYLPVRVVPNQDATWLHSFRFQAGIVFKFAHGS